MTDDYKLQEKIEFQLFNYIISNNTILNEIDFDKRFFKYQDILETLKKLYNTYHKINSELIISSSANKNGARQFLTQVFTIDEEILTNTECISIYKFFRENFKRLKIEELNKKLGVSLEYDKYLEEMSKLIQLNFESNELVKVKEIEPQFYEREYTNINELDYLLKGIEYGKLSLWSGLSNEGKSTFMQQFAKECLKRGKKIFFFAGENTSYEFKNLLYVSMCTKDELDFIQDSYNPRIYNVTPKPNKLKMLDEKFGDLIYLYNNNIQKNDIDSMIRVMTLAFKQGVRIFFIDNFMQLDDSEKLENQTRIIELFKRFARDKNSIVNLVAHPRKTQFSKHRLSMFDISGSQNIANKSANICSIMRVDTLPDDELKQISFILDKNDYDIKDCDAIIEVLKTKGNACKMVGLTFDKELKIYKEAPKILPSQRKNNF